MKSLLHLGNCIVSGLVLIALAGLALAACTTAATPTQTAVVIQTTPSNTPSPPPTPTPTTLPTINPTSTPVHTPTPSLTRTATSTLGTVADFDISDLSPSAGLREIKGFTATFALYVQNRVETPAPETTFYLFEGDPQKGGTLIARQDIPELGGYDGSNLEEALFSTAALWNVEGKAGDNELFSYLCPAGAALAPAICRTHHWTETIPRLNWDIEVTGERELIELPRKGRVGKLFDHGDVVSITIYAANLGTTETLSFTLKTVVENETQVFVLAEEDVILPPREMVERTYRHDTTEHWRSQSLALLRLAGDIEEVTQNYLPEVYKLDAFYLPEDAYFIAELLSGTVPLTVAFMDRSGPVNRIQTWWWDFGDGLTSALSSPTHTYTTPGAYTVTLTTTVQGHDLNWVRALSGRGAVSDGSIFTQTFTFTFTRPNYINVYLPLDFGQNK